MTRIIPHATVPKRELPSWLDADALVEAGNQNQQPLQKTAAESRLGWLKEDPTRFSKYLRKFEKPTAPSLPIKRSLTPEEREVMNHFYSEYSWSDVDSLGRIILGNGVDLEGLFYLTEEGLHALKQVFNNNTRVGSFQEIITSYTCQNCSKVYRTDHASLKVQANLAARAGEEVSYACPKCEESLVPYQRIQSKVLNKNAGRYQTMTEVKRDLVRDK